MKVLFLIPPAEHSLRKAHEKDNGYGLGRAYLMSYLKAHGHEVDTIPFNMCSDEEYLSNLTNKLNSFRPDFVSITMFSVNRVMGFKCIEHIDDKDAKILHGKGVFHLNHIAPNSTKNLERELENFLIIPVWVVASNKIKQTKNYISIM